MPSPEREGIPDKRRGLYGQRPSASHDPVCRKEFERIASLSARERMIEALDLDDEVQAMLPAEGDGDKPERGEER